MAILTRRDASHKILGLVLWCWIVFHNGFHFLLVSLTISLEEVVCIGLRWRIGVWVIEKILDTEEHLFDCDGWFPTLFFVQD